MSLASRSAPRSSNSFAISMWPLNAAQIRGVWPSCTRHWNHGQQHFELCVTASLIEHSRGCGNGEARPRRRLVQDRRGTRSWHAASATPQSWAPCRCRTWSLASRFASRASKKETAPVLPWSTAIRSAVAPRCGSRHIVHFRNCTADAPFRARVTAAGGNHLRPRLLAARTHDSVIRGRHEAGSAKARLRMPPGTPMGGAAGCVASRLTESLASMSARRSSNTPATSTKPLAQARARAVQPACKRCPRAVNSKLSGSYGTNAAWRAPRVLAGMRLRKRVSTSSSFAQSTGAPPSTSRATSAALPASAASQTARPIAGERSGTAPIGQATGQL